MKHSASSSKKNASPRSSTPTPACRVKVYEYGEYPSFSGKLSALTVSGTLKIASYDKYVTYSAFLASQECNRRLGQALKHAEARKEQLRQALLKAARRNEALQAELEGAQKAAQRWHKAFRTGKY